MKDNNGKLINSIAAGLYERLYDAAIPTPFTDEHVRNFKSAGRSLKFFMLDYARRIESKYESINLFIRQYENICRTPLITDEEINKLVNADLGFHQSHKISNNKNFNWQSFFTELNYLIPSELKKNGYEVIRKEEISEINDLTINKLARAIHSAYMHEVRNKVTGSKGISGFYTSSFDNLPDDIKLSNIDNAANIPSKLLSIGYKIRKVKKGFKPYALHLNEKQIETMAKVEHIRWSWEKRLNGWTYGTLKDESKKTHPGLITYEELSESEKDKDRELVKLIPAFLHDIDYEAYPVSPNRIRKLSYAIKPQSSINRILTETRDLNEQIRSLINMTPHIEEIINIRNRKIEEAIREVEGSYNYAQHIQETFLPDDFFVRESLPDSFILFKPKDIVSGDFYFLSKQDDLLIFAVADCTGHGIPGALLSTLGYGILDQAVNEIKLADPSLILQHLYSKIHRYLRNFSGGNGIPDDMDIILCSLDTRTNLLLYSAVKNPLYRISNGQLLEYSAQNSTNTNCSEGECNFVSTKIQLTHSDTLYLSSDGYSDQFGGKSHKRYQRTRFKNFILGLNDCSMPEQSDRLYEEMEKWREENNEEQTDDILILGIRI